MDDRAARWTPAPPARPGTAHHGPTPEDIRRDAWIRRRPQYRRFPTIGKALRDGGFEMADVVRAHYYITDQAFVDAFAAAISSNKADAISCSRT